MSKVKVYVIMFKNHSGDDPVVLGVSTTKQEEPKLREKVISRIGDDYADGEICGDYWVQETGIE
jgi:hypothetical protein